MAEYVARDIKDRIVLGGNKYTMEQLGGGKVRLTPAPDTGEIIEEGTPVNAELLQLMEDRITLLMNEVFGKIGDVVVKTYFAREIKDRVAFGDDKYTIEQLADGRVRLTPAPDSVTEVGTDINKALLQPMEDQIAMLMNRVFGTLSANPFLIKFTSVTDVTANGIWNESAGRMEC